jgi:hypothetical protein
MSPEHVRHLVCEHAWTVRDQIDDEKTWYCPLCESERPLVKHDDAAASAVPSGADPEITRT